MKFRKYRKLRRRGYTIRGLYKVAREEGHSPKTIVEMLIKVLPCGGNPIVSREEVVKFMREMEFGEEECFTCQKIFISEPGGSICMPHCPECEKKIDEMWKVVYATAKEQGEELDENTSLFAGLLINTLVGASNVK